MASGARLSRIPFYFLSLFLSNKKQLKKTFLRHKETQKKKTSTAVSESFLRRKKFTPLYRVKKGS